MWGMETVFFIFVISLLIFVVARIWYLDAKDHPEHAKEFKVFLSEVGEVFFIKSKQQDKGEE